MTTVLKFGGSSVATADRIRAVHRLVADAAKQGQVGIVLSALQGVTDQLLLAASQAREDWASAQATWQALQQRHLQLARELCPDDQALRAQVEKLGAELRDRLQGISLLQESSKQAVDAVLSFGERLSCLISAAYFTSQGLASQYVDAAEVIRTDDQFGSASVDFTLTNELLRQRLARLNATPLITGFLGATVDGKRTTLGRGGSDYTASIVGAALGADRIEIWTDVDGVMSADPRVVPEAVSLPSLSYQEAMELSYFGAKVIHPATMAPAVRAGIPIVIKNTFNPSFTGTLISAATSDNGPVKGVAVIRQLALLNIQGSGLPGRKGIAGRIFHALGEASVNIIMISQASSEHSICLLIKADEVAAARKALERELQYEIAQGFIQQLGVVEPVASVCAVGEGMRGTPGIAGKLFSALGQAGVNVLAIAQGSSELNVSLAVADKDADGAMRAIHQAFRGSASGALSSVQVIAPAPAISMAHQSAAINVVIAGVGHVGQALLTLLAQRDQARQPLVRVVGLINRSRMALAPEGIDPKRWQIALTDGEPASLPKLLRLADEAGLPNRVLVDVTAAPEVARAYHEALERGWHVVTSNKLGSSGVYQYYRELQQLCVERHCRYLYRAAVGAGLPVLATIRSLAQTGDRILEVTGALSGTLGYVLSAVERGQAFSAAVRQAYQLGYTEPDPRQDLSGLDVARKLVIISRAAGLQLELDDLEVESLVPESLNGDVPLDRFWQELPLFDQRYQRKGAEPGILRYVAHLERGQAAVGLRNLPSEHPIARLQGSDNLVAIRTERYPQPLIIQGAGAGPQVTAGNVLADILSVIR